MTSTSRQDEFAMVMKGTLVTGVSVDASPRPVMVILVPPYAGPRVGMTDNTFGPVYRNSPLRRFLGFVWPLILTITLAFASV
jgi:hypothetical protein